MASFSFAACAAVLFEASPKLEDVERALETWNVAGRPNEGEGEHGWAICGPGFMVDLRSGAFAVVDLVRRPWPDDVRDAESVPAIGSAWSVGAFGRGSTPGALARAADQPWSWTEGSAAAARHEAFVRLRIGHAAEEGAPETGAEDPSYELMSLTELARPLLRMPGALAFFVPAGEALRSREQMDAALQRKIGAGPPPFELWTNLRAVMLAEEGGLRWLGLDTIGMMQLGIPDQEAIFADGKEAPGAVEALLHNVCRHLLSGKPVASGSTAEDGRGRRWRASGATGLVAPRRPVVRWLPEESDRPPDALLAKLSATAGTG
jgi:hypothetical protein